MNKIINQTATSLIEAFLHAKENPTANDWKDLIEKNPTFAEDIVDLAFLYGRVNLVTENAVNEPLDSNLFESVEEDFLNVIGSNLHLIAKAENALQECKGPAARIVAKDIGFREHVDLFNQMLSGELQAPYVLVKRLADRLSVPWMSLVEVFSINFKREEAQAFKAQGKPIYESETTSWREAIKAAGLTKEDTQYFLDLEKAEY